MLIKLLSNQDRYNLSEKIEKKSGGYGTQTSEMGLLVDHTSKSIH